MTVKELFDFITDPTITEKNMEACLDKLSELADSRGAEPTHEERVDEEVFKSAYIPQTLTEVIDFERDISMVKSAASGKALDDLHYRTLLGMGQDLKPLKIPTLLVDCENSEEDEGESDEEKVEEGLEEETEEDCSKFINSARPRDESPNSKKARKKAVKDQQAEKRKTKVPKHVKKRNEKSKKTK